MFHEIRFPANLSFGSVGGPERRTEIVALANGFEERNSPWAHSRRHYDAGVGLRERLVDSGVVDGAAVAGLLRRGNEVHDRAVLPEHRLVPVGQSGTEHAAERGLAQGGELPVDELLAGVDAGLRGVARHLVVAQDGAAMDAATKGDGRLAALPRNGEPDLAVGEGARVGVDLEGDVVDVGLPRHRRRPEPPHDHRDLGAEGETVRIARRAPARRRHPLRPARARR